MKLWSVKNGFPVWSKQVLTDPDVKADPVLSSISPLSPLGRNYSIGFQGATAVDADVMWPLVEQVLSGADPAKSLKAASKNLDATLSKF